MKYSDIQRIQEAGLISAEQRQRIIDHFGLKEDASRVLAILSLIGGVLAVAGILLLIGANWDEIPRGVKVAAGLVLMAGAYAGGFWLRDRRGDYPKAGEALLLLGSGMFLANIALVGQIYHLSSRLPNAFLLWWLGIAALPWILRSLPQHALALGAFIGWFGSELWDSGSWFYCGNGPFPLLLLALLGLVFYGGGLCLRRSAWREFAGITERLGLLLFFVLQVPLIIGEAARGFGDKGLGVQAGEVLFPVLALVGLGLVATGLGRDARLSLQWRWTWGGALAASVGLLAAAGFGPESWRENLYVGGWHASAISCLAALTLFVVALLLVNVGVADGSKFSVNLGVSLIAADVILTYFTLIGSMAQTGLIFLVSGVFLIAFGIYLEKRRRVLLGRLRVASGTFSPE